MKTLLPLIIFPWVVCAEPSVEKSPITAEQLAEELDFDGGNWRFQFDQPVHAMVKLEMTELSKGFSGTSIATSSPATTIDFGFVKRSQDVGGYDESHLSVTIYLNGSKAGYAFRNPLNGINHANRPSSLQELDLDVPYHLINAVADGDPSKFIRLTLTFVNSLP